LYIEKKVSAIYLVGNVSEMATMVVRSDEVDVTKYLKKQQICKYFYDVTETYDPEDVIRRATESLGSTLERLPFKNPHHFAMWCKTGSYHLQLQC